MVCQSCAADALHVVDTRPAGDAAVRRRRECDACCERFTTYERAPTGEPRAVLARIRELAAAGVEERS
jgi:transcriptional repressor NrdR